jgi:hypothetical protein
LTTVHPVFLLVRQSNHFIVALLTFRLRHVYLLATSTPHFPFCKHQSRTLTQLTFPLIYHIMTTSSTTI